MRNSPARVLLVGHSASRNGATVLLLEELNWLKTHTDWDIEVLMCGGGPLLENFRALAPTKVWCDPRHSLGVLLKGRSRRLLPFLERHYARWTLPRAAYDLVYCNTSAMARHIPHFARLGSPILWHIHELPFAMEVSVEPEEEQPAVLATTRFVAVSSAVRDAITSRWGAPAHAVDVVHGFVRPAAEDEGTLLGQRRERTRERLGFTKDAFVVGACGKPCWRKGTDLFLQIAARVQRERGNARFLWVGGSPDGEEALMFRHDMRALDLEPQCVHVADTADVEDTYLAMDAFALTSREDPFPLVMLEAGRHRLPIVCFQKSGGAEEFVNDEAGLSVPYLDVDAFAERLIHLCDDVEARRRIGATAFEKVRRHHTVGVQCGHLLTSMLACMTLDSETADQIEKRPASHPRAL